MKEENIILKKIAPEEGKHLKDIETGDIYEGEIYLGKYDTPDNYVEVTEEEYQEYLKEKHEGKEITEAGEEIPIKKDSSESLLD